MIVVTGLVCAAWNITCLDIMNITVPHTSDTTCCWIPRTMWLSWVRGWSQEQQRTYLCCYAISSLGERRHCATQRQLSFIVFYLRFFIYFLLFFHVFCSVQLCSWTKPGDSEVLCHHPHQLIILKAPPRPPKKRRQEVGGRGGLTDRKWLGGLAGRGSLAFLFLL